jgi:hypothetical protein
MGKIPIFILKMEQCLPKIIDTDAPTTQEFREPELILLNDLVPFELSPEMTIPVKQDGSLLHNASDYQNLHRRIRWKYNQVLTIYDEISILSGVLVQEIIEQIDPGRRVTPPIPVGDSYWRLAFHYEAYLAAVKSLLELISKLTRYAFPTNKPPERFTRQREWFIERMPDADPDYRSYLAAKLGWYDDLKRLRDQIIHHSAIEVRVRASEAKLGIIASTGITRSEADFIDIQEVCARIHTGLQEFLVFFDQHFAGRL